MGTIYDRGKGDRVNLWIRFRDVDGETKWRGVGRVNPTGKTAAEVRAEGRELRKVAARVLAQAELNVSAGLPAFPEEHKPAALPLFEVAALEWAEGRVKTHPRSGHHDLQRTKLHLIPTLRGKRIDEVTTGEVRKLIDRLQDTLSGATIQRVLMVLSRLYNDLRERDVAVVNPVASLGKATRRRARSTHDPHLTPFLRTKSEIRRVYLELPDHVRPLFAVGSLAGLRNAEILALQWRDVDLDRRRITVERQKVKGGPRRKGEPVEPDATGPVKDGESRVAPINDSLLVVLRAWKLRRESEVWCFPSKLGGMMNTRTLNKALAAVLEKLPDVERVSWYQATRHTFASHWIMDGGSIEKLREILGHCSVVVTERYAHLKPEAFNATDYRTACVDLAPSKVLAMDRERRRVDNPVDTPAAAEAAGQG